MLTLEPGDLPVLTALLLPTGDREVFQTCFVASNEGYFYHSPILVKISFLFYLFTLSLQGGILHVD